MSVSDPKRDTETVFISYSHDSDEHRETVLRLSERLRSDGLETRLDRYVNGTPAQGWPRWMLDQLDEADFVLVVCTESYYRRFRGHEMPGKGKGVGWEGALITQELYDAHNTTVKFVPVMLGSGQVSFIPEPLRGLTHYTLTSEQSYQALYDFLVDQAGVEPGRVGEVKTKPRRKASPLTFLNWGEATPSVTPQVSAGHRSQSEIAASASVVARPWPHQTRPSLENGETDGHETDGRSRRKSILAGALNVFISYIDEDNDSKEELNKHLAHLRRSRDVHISPNITAGEEVQVQIEKQLNDADLILLLVSAAFIASDDCYRLAQQALERHQQHKARVIPILLAPCDWEDTPWAKLKVLPTDARPVSTWEKTDAAWWNVVQGLRTVIDSLRGTVVVPTMRDTMTTVGGPHWRSEAKPRRRHAHDESAVHTAGELWIHPMLQIPFRYIPDGTFKMGSPADEQERRDNEKLHTVTLSRGFWMAETVVTQRHWRRIFGNNPSRFEGIDRPVERVSWYDAIAFAMELSKQSDVECCYEVYGVHGQPGEGLSIEDVQFLPNTDGYRLPTEAEWEYAARAGTDSAFSTGNRLTTDEANYNGMFPYAGHSKGSYLAETKPVGDFEPNCWGLREMHGNVWEWVWDWYAEYPPKPVIDPAGPAIGTRRVARGGGWNSNARSCRAAHRAQNKPEDRYSYCGFRLVTDLTRG